MSFRGKGTVKFLNKQILFAYIGKKLYLCGKFANYTQRYPYQSYIY